MQALFLFEHAVLEGQRYRGGPSDVDVTLAVGNSGDTQIELIYGENDAPSLYKEFLDSKQHSNAAMAARNWCITTQ